MKKLIKPGYIDFLKSEAESVLAEKDPLMHSELEKEFSRGLLDLIDLIKDLDATLRTMSVTILPEERAATGWTEAIYPKEDADD